jgi:hypothetical protein
MKLSHLLAIGLLTLLVVAVVPVVADGAGAQPAPVGSPNRWFKGNTHTHTLNSDGDSTPDDVVRWYREHGYHFVVLTDHNFLTSVDGLNALHGASQKFLVVKGEELTDRADGKPLHINGLDVSREIAAQGGSTIVEVLQRSVDAIRGANGVPHINHPNFGWAITTDQLAQVKNNRLFEIFNGHPQVNNVGGGGVPGLEEMWDALLSRGIDLYGIAVDDAHYFKQAGNPDLPGPGRGWVYVRAPQLEARALVEALDRGDFYASTGVVLDDLRVDAKTITVTVKPETWAKYRIQFIGKNGRLLRETMDSSATYQFTGDEGYVRARVLESSGRRAWIQPTRVPPRRSQADVVLIGALFAIAASASWKRSRPSRLASFARGDRARASRNRDHPTG